MIKIDIDRMAKILGVPTLSEFEEKVSDQDSDTYSCAYKAAVEEGLSEDLAYEQAQEAVWNETKEVLSTYRNSLVNIFEKEVENLDLEVSELRTRPGQFAIMPKTSWMSSANKMRTIVHGIAGWYTHTLKEFLATGPYTPRTMVEGHLGYVGQQWELYGYSSPKSRVFN